MALNILRRVSKYSLQNSLKSQRRFSGLWEPDYLNITKSEIPEYPILNIKIQSYSFPSLEMYQRHMHKLAESFDIDVEDSWALPAKNYKIKLFKENTTAVDKEYLLNIYERNTQCTNVTSKNAPLFIRMLEATLPEGVNLQIAEFDYDLERRRYVPDKELLDLKSELESLQNPEEPTKKKK